MNYNKLLTVLIIIVTIILFIELFMLVLLSTGGYHSPLCVDSMLVNKLGIGKS